MPRTKKQIHWKANLTDNLKLASASKSGDGHVVLAFYQENLTSRLPDWNINATNQTIRKPFSHFWKLISDTLVEYQPVIRLGYYTDPGAGSCFYLKARLVGFLYSSDQTAVKDEDGKYYLHLHLKLNGPQCLPTRLENISIQINSRQLPYEKYSYQFCNKSANNLPCNFISYLKAVGTYRGNKGEGKDNCRLFILSEGNPHQYCSIVVGT